MPKRPWLFCNRSLEKSKVHPHILGVALPFSGPMKPYGNDLLNGIRLAIDIAKEQWGLTSVGLVVKDTTTLNAPLRTGNATIA